MWPSCAHVLKPLTDSSGMKNNKSLKWIDEMQAAFNKICLLKAPEELFAFLDQNKCFDVYKDSSDYQMGACIMQDGQPVAYYSKNNSLILLK
jgi:hypothetical protein